MKALVIALAFAFVTASTWPTAAEARRIGGGGSIGMQRSMPPRAAPEALPARPATPTAVPAQTATAAAAAPRRSWMGPIAGLAAGLGIAALMSHFGVGAEFGNILMIALLAFVAFVAIRFVMRRFAGSGGAVPGMQVASAGAGAGTGAGTGSLIGGSPTTTMPMNRATFDTPVSSWAAAPSAAAGSAGMSIPAGFDAAAFERIAKMIFIRMQAANDASDLNDLRNFTTPEMFAAVRLDLQERGPQTQRTDVVRVDAEVLDVASEAERQIVSVRFHGLIREERDGGAEPFNEIWHLVKPADGSREWAIAGIQQTADALAKAA